MEVQMRQLTIQTRQTKWDEEVSHSECSEVTRRQALLLALLLRLASILLYLLIL